MSFLLRCATTAHRVSFFKSAGLLAAGFLRQHAGPGSGHPIQWRCLHPTFTGLLKANFCSLRVLPRASQWAMNAQLGKSTELHTDCTGPERAFTQTATGRRACRLSPHPCARFRIDEEPATNARDAFRGEFIEQERVSFLAVSLSALALGTARLASCAIPRLSLIHI